MTGEHSGGDVVKCRDYIVIGAGSIGRRHQDNLIALGQNSTLMAWRSFDMAAFEQRLERAAGTLGVVIATATDVRLPLITLCAQHNAPMYIEKPVAFDPAELANIYTIPLNVQKRSVIGFMMRYHPLVQHLRQMLSAPVFRAHLTIGHDVNQWRKNWRFSQSYASKEGGGGVLLDLCHEIDIAHLLLHPSALLAVTSTGHARFRGVDIASNLTFALPDAGVAVVSMDYLAPKLIRRGVFVSNTQEIHYDLADNSVRRITADGDETRLFECDRNMMFMDIMRDFIALANHERPQNQELTPRMDVVKDSCALIAQAWKRRHFIGNYKAEIL